MARLRERVTAFDLDLIQRLFRFVNMDFADVKSQYEVFKVWEDHPYVARIELSDRTIKPHIKPLPEEEGIVWLENHAYEMEINLQRLTSKDRTVVSKVLEQVPQMLREKVKFVVDYELKPGKLKIVGRPVLDGMEAILWYAVALIAHYDLMRFLKCCKLELKGGKPVEQRGQGTPCGKFFLYGTEQRDSHGRRVELRTYCTPRHAELGKEQAVLTAIKAWQKDKKKTKGRRR